MRLRLPCAFLLLTTILATGKQEKKEPDEVNISGNTMEAPFFKLHYSFPQGWSPENDDVRKEKNRKAHEDAVKRAEAAQARVINPGVTTTKIFWNYELFMGRREAEPSDESSRAPSIVVRAAERADFVMNEAGDNARMFSRVHTIKLLEGPKEQKISGHKFMRSVLVFHSQEDSEQFEIMYESVSGKYFLVFEFHAKTQQEANELSQTMESVKFDK